MNSEKKQVYLGVHKETFLAINKHPELTRQLAAKQLALIILFHQSTNEFCRLSTKGLARVSGLHPKVVQRKLTLLESLQIIRPYIDEDTGSRCYCVPSVPRYKSRRQESQPVQESLPF